MTISRTVFVVVAFETVDSYGTQVSHVDSVWATRALSDARAKAIVDDQTSDWFAETEEHQVIGSDGGGVEGTRSEAKGRGAEMRPEQSGVSGGAAQEQVPSPARHSIEKRLDEAVALLRGIEEWLPCIEVGSIRDGVERDKYMEKRRKFLDGEP